MFRACHWQCRLRGVDTVTWIVVAGAHKIHRTGVADPLCWWVLLLMAMTGRAERAFAAFVREMEPRLRQALVATYGPVDGREATVDALSWAWEHWDRLSDVPNPGGYLYRVGQSAVRRFGSRPLPIGVLRTADAASPDLSPELVPALARLSAQQRTVVLLVHAYSWSQADVATLLEISPSTVREHMNRALARLRDELEIRNAC